MAVTAHPTAAWVWRQLLEATAWGRHPKYLIRDRDRVYDGDLVGRAVALGIDTLLTPYRAPKANAIAERVVRTLRNECLDHVLILDERHLRRVLVEYVPTTTPSARTAAWRWRHRSPPSEVRQRQGRSARDRSWAGSITCIAAPPDEDGLLAPYSIW